MLDEFRQIMKEHYGIDKVEPTSNFKTDFGLSSFDFINLICLIEEKYGVELEEEYYKELNTVEDLIIYLKQRVGNV
ncbi:MAG: acyl carrier protein [Lachnospiraceae bacterium]|jgi:acyl carrier protein|nr:acyl carrier protein [Lachnospiraceae bacterium]